MLCKFALGSRAFQANTSLFEKKCVGSRMVENVCVCARIFENFRVCSSRVCLSRSMSRLKNETD